MTLSVICPIYNEEKYIAQFFNSLLQQDYLKAAIEREKSYSRINSSEREQSRQNAEYDLEILLVDGMSKDNTRSIVAGYTAQYPFVRLIDNPDKIVPYAMNRGIVEAHGDIIIRLDAHAEYPTNYFSELIKQINDLEGAENVGGVCVTLPCNDTSRAIAIAECLSHKFGMGNSYFRVGSKKVMCVDTVPFGCFRRSLFDKIGLYDPDLIRNQDDELNGRIIKHGGKIYLLPQLEVRYFARDKVAKVRNMFYQYGLYKPLVNKKLGAPATLRQFVPLLFVLGLLLGFMLSIVSKGVFWMYLGLLLFYFLIGFLIGIGKARKWRRASVAFWMPAVFFVMHFAYGWGYICGIMKLLFHLPFNAESNR